MAVIKASALRPGDVIGIVAPASPPRSAERVERSVRYFERLGYRVEVGKHLTPIQATLSGKSDRAQTQLNDYLAASDKDRVSDLHAMFRAKRVKAMFYHRGGYGSIRLLDRIDYDLIRQNPKIIVGYSDATSLFAALNKKAGLASCFFGPMPGVDLWDDVDPFAEENFWRAMTSTKPIGNLPMAESEGASVNMVKSVVEGRMIGGNLTVFCSLMGTPYQPSFRNAIPFLEEIDEKPRRVDAHFAHLRLAGLWSQSKAVLLGQFTNCNVDADAPTRTLNEILIDYFGTLKIPVVSGLPFGHEARKWTLPWGAKLRVAQRKGRNVISVLDSALE
ncbi:MAG: LD-carboxypeptidase [Bacteroidota bacterium]|nr:LD-carboxypeptidase [Bacteroidota bacterium]MDP4233557.1 LD-carboxypeptidase [Bacteroidota bacterium]MDP4243668.1 LD-carboxypeptidase [Bacteroidota bacterium]MDP4287743.1 LD-carboxypeptidase [Bacteroidota bacterium]